MVRIISASLLLSFVASAGFAQKNTFKEDDFFKRKLAKTSYEALSSAFTTKQSNRQSTSTQRELSDHFQKSFSASDSKKEPASAFSIRTRASNSTKSIPDHFIREQQSQKKSQEIDHFQNTKLELNKATLNDHFTYEKVRSSKRSENDHFAKKENNKKGGMTPDHFSAEHLEIKRRESDLSNRARPKKSLRKNFVGQKYRIINSDPNKSKAKTKAIKRSKNKNKDPFGRNSQKVNQPQGPKGENGLFQGGVLPKMEDLR